MRWNPNATGETPETSPGELPPSADVRQMSLLGAGWTLGSIKYLARGGADSITYYKTVGIEGIMQDDAGASVPAPFPTLPDAAVYPMFAVFAWITALADADIVDSHSSDPLTLDGLVLRNESETRILLANYTGEAQTVRLVGPAMAMTVQHLDVSTVYNLFADPAAFLNASGANINMADGLTLAAYSVVLLKGATP
jgi:hypothetical protein